MNSKLFITPNAETDIYNSVLWYEEELKGLGSSFLLSVDAMIESISRNPEAYPKIYKNIRRGLIRKFPFGIYYIIEKERIVILAVFHVRRNPKDWKKRVS